MLDVQDFGPNPHVPAYGGFGAVTIRWAKGTAGSGPRRRTVLTVPEFDWVVDLLTFWAGPQGRGRLTYAERSSALWPSERAIRITLGSLGDAFAQVRSAVGLPKELGLHCLRHSHVTHLIEAGYDPAFVQILLSSLEDVRDVQHEAGAGGDLRGGGGYLRPSITQMTRRFDACAAGVDARLVA